MPSFLSFITFLGSQQSLKPRQLESIHKILFQSSEPRIVSLADLARTLELPITSVIDLVEDLQKYGVIQLETTRCSRCFHDHHHIVMYCESCGQDLLSSTNFKVDGCLTGTELEIYKQYQSRRLNALLYARQWIEKGFSYYLLIDLLGSEVHQTNESDAYNHFFEVFREKLNVEVLRSLRTPYLELGEVGDCIKIAFLDAEEAYRVIQQIAELLRTHDWLKVAPELCGGTVDFPRFDGTLGKIFLTKQQKRSPERLFAVTLGGALDFNSVELTRLFRYDQKISTNREIFKTTFVATWFQDQVLVDIGEDWSKAPTREVKIDKHKEIAQYSSNFGLLRIDEDGEYFETQEQLLLHNF